MSNNPTPMSTDEIAAKGKRYSAYFESLAQRTYYERGDCSRLESVATDIPRLLVTIAERDERLKEAEGLLEELHTLVRGECPSLLNEDSGGNGTLDVTIAAFLEGRKG